MSGARKISVLRLEAGRCVGTIHEPAQRLARIGVLWVNFGYVPRDGHGGLAAHLSDALADRGVPCFRFDLPGLGDAEGTLPAHTQHFFPMVTGGHFTAVTTELVRTLCKSERLDGLIVGGLCGGAVNALFTAEAETQLVKGLILLEPEMYITEPKKEAAPQEGRVRRRDQLKAKIFSYWGWMRLLTLENRYGRYVPLPRKAILNFLMSRTELPAVTNRPLAQAWQAYCVARRPSLVITAQGKLREVFFDSIHSKVLAGAVLPRMRHARLKDTNHIFTTGGALERVTQVVVDAWPMLSQGEEGAPASTGTGW